MKKLLLAAAVLITSFSAFGQGQVVFANATATKITNSATLQAAAAGLHVGLYVANGLSQPEASLTLLTQTNVFASGLFSGGTRTLPNGYPAGNVTLQIRAWSGAFTSYEEALVAAVVDHITLVGKSITFNHVLTEPLNLPSSVATEMNQFNVAPITVPEPSSIALGLLGLGAVALFRRRK